MEADTRRCKVNVTENAPEESKGVKQAQLRTEPVGAEGPGYCHETWVPVAIQL